MPLHKGPENWKIFSTGAGTAAAAGGAPEDGPGVAAEAEAYLAGPPAEAVVGPRDWQIGNTGAQAAVVAGGERNGPGSEVAEAWPLACQQQPMEPI